MRNVWLIAILFCGLSLKAQRPIDVTHYTFKISLSDSSDRIYGEADIEFQAQQPVTRIEIDLGKYDKTGKGMQVSYVARHGDRNGDWTERLAFQWISENRIRIELNKPVEKGQVVSIRIEYNGIPRDGLIISKNKYGERTFFADNWPNRAHQWIPCVDDPADKASVEFMVKAPLHYKVVSNGVTSFNNITLNGISVSKWVEEIPVPTKVMVIGVARFAVDTVGFFRNTIPVTSWVFPQDSAVGFKTYAQALPILQWMQNYIGPYAYKKLANVQSKTIFGGMENANAIFYYEQSVNGKRNEESLIAHEIAHQWFGNMATEKSFHHLWLSEGFATYMTHQYMESVYGESTLQKRLQEDREKINEFLSRTPRSVIDTTANYMSLLNANSYEKGGWVLHMIRRQVGDELFRTILRTYYETYSGKNADTDDFQRIVESVTKKDWSVFFKQWLTQKTNPSLALKWENSVDGKFVHLTVRQVQNAAPFIFPLTLDIVNQQGEKKRLKIDVVQAEQKFVLPSNGYINSLILDPETDLLLDKFTDSKIEH